MIFAIALYFSSVVMLAALVSFAPARAWFKRGVHRVIRLMTRIGALTRRGSNGALNCVGQGISRLAARRVSAIATLAVIALPSLLVWSYRDRATLDGYADAARDANAQVAELLRGEQLIAPSPLPPAVFVTREVEAVRPALGGADRDWNLLDQSFRRRLLWIVKRMREDHGYELVLIEGYRSPERQKQLQMLGSAVTNAGAYQSYHQYGLAADCAFFRDGKLIVSERDAWVARGYTLYGQLAERAGLTWGGRWTMRDLGHIELQVPDARRRTRG